VAKHTWIAIVAVLIYLPMVLEARRAARHERARRARGGIEPRGDVYDVMRVAYPASFLAILVEGLARGGEPGVAAAAGAVLFGGAKALKWWAIAALGPAWTFRILVIPRAPLVTTGPYRYLAHPNYLGVMGELAGAALLAGASIAGPVATLAFGSLVLRRIAVERRALRSGRDGTC
jgi:methyltransferase